MCARSSVNANTWSTDLWNVPFVWNCLHNAFAWKPKQAQRTVKSIHNIVYASSNLQWNRGNSQFEFPMRQLYLLYYVTVLLYIHIESPSSNLLSSILFRFRQGLTTIFILYLFKRIYHPVSFLLRIVINFSFKLSQTSIFLIQSTFLKFNFLSLVSFFIRGVIFKICYTEFNVNVVKENWIKIITYIDSTGIGAGLNLKLELEPKPLINTTPHLAIFI